MPRKIRQLKADLRDAGYVRRPGKGRHTVWDHPLIRNGVTLSGADGDDAKPYAGTRCPPSDADDACCPPEVTVSAHEECSSYRRYSMLIERSDEDDAYIVTIPELPGYVTHGATHVEAVQQGEDAIESWLDAAIAWGRPIPEPRVVQYSSG